MGIKKKKDPNDPFYAEYPIIEEHEGGAIMLANLEALVNWSRKNSLWPLTFGTRCCAIEFMAAGASRHDFARFGAEVARATPRQAPRARPTFSLSPAPSPTKWRRCSNDSTTRCPIPNGSSPWAPAP